MLCVTGKKGEKGDENAEDIAVEINKEEPPADADVEAGKPEETPATAAEKEELLNGNGDPVNFLILLTGLLLETNLFQQVVLLIVLYGTR